MLKKSRRTRAPGRVLSHYHVGQTSVFASKIDQRFSWCAQVPSDYDPEGNQRYPLAVVVHGTERDALGYRDQFAEFCERHGCIVMAPLFPAGIDAVDELDNYKLIRYLGIRFDSLLLGMVEELGELYRLDGSDFLLHGFSGGGHFAHRFFYLHPDRLRGLSIGAPGVVTLLDPHRDWWVGTRNVESEFQVPWELERLRRVPVQMVIGATDLESWEITLGPGNPMYLPGINDAGANRLERLEALQRSFENAGISVRCDVVPGVGHDGFAVLDPVKSFFSDLLTARTAADEDGRSSE